MSEDEDPLYDIAVVGGGINGAGIARDAAGRGLKTLLLEARDLAQATSSASTKLIHGGLRYLEYYEFLLVRKALQERETLLEMAPHIIWPLEFILPHNDNLRPKWMIRAGLWLYDHMAKRKKLPGSRSVNLATEEQYGGPLSDDLTFGFSYSDCWVEDSRLVILNAVDAAERGATIKLREPCRRLDVDEYGHWVISTPESTYRARKLVNATGPWVDRLLHDTAPTECRNAAQSIRLVKGSHIILPKMYDGDHCYILQLADNRIIFAIPYERNFTLIGTTDVDFKMEKNEDIYDIRITDDEIKYLCESVSANFKKKITPEDVLWTYSGVRPLLDESGPKDNYGESASAVTRDYKLVKTHYKNAPMVNIYGGKITTYRKLAEAVMMELGHEKTWTHKSPLPGGDIENADFGTFFKDLCRKYSWLNEEVLHRLARGYGTRVHTILGTAGQESDLGEHYGDGVYEAEIRYLITKEWARDLEDILFRRTKLGLHISQQTADNIEQGMKKI